MFWRRWRATVPAVRVGFLEAESPLESRATLRCLLLKGVSGVSEGLLVGTTPRAAPEVARGRLGWSVAGSGASPAAMRASSRGVSGSGEDSREGDRERSDSRRRSDSTEGERVGEAERDESRVRERRREDDLVRERCNDDVALDEDGERAGERVVEGEGMGDALAIS